MVAFGLNASLAVLIIGAVSAAPVPDFVARHRSRSASLAGLKLVDGDVKAHSYIVQVSSTTANHEGHMAWVDSLVAKSKASSATHASNCTAWNTYSAELDDDAVSQLLSSKDVEWVEEDGVLHTMGTQTGAPWGLQRLSAAQPIPANSNPSTLDFTYKFADAAGEGVDVYVIDTGVRDTHVDFGGRAKMVFASPGLPMIDDNGHGSHVAGTVAGTTFGVAKKAKILGVKVMAGDGSGATSDIIAGIDFSVRSARASGRPSVISMSIGGSKSFSLDRAATAAVNAGIHVIAAAGNDARDARNDSPASAPGVIGVGASNINDVVSRFSNFGPDVDIFAPGENIISVGIGADDDVSILSGTSQATPHVSGLVALLLSQVPTVTPAKMEKLIQQLALRGVLRGAVPSTTPNLLAQNFVSDALKAAVKVGSS